MTENQTVWKSDNQGDKHSSRPVGRAETGSRVERTCGKSALGGSGRARWRLADPGGSGLWTGRSHTCVQINQKEQLGTETDCATQSSSAVK